MRNEQSERFETIRALVDDAKGTLAAMEELANSGLDEVDSGSSEQGACLQTLQMRAGEAVETLTEAANVARHARSYQAQQHHRHSR